MSIQHFQNQNEVKYFWYDYPKPNFGENSKFCYLGTDCFVANMKADDIYIDIAEDLETRFDTSNYELDRPLPKKKYKSNWISER